MVKAALVMEAGRFSSLATFRQAFFLITCTTNRGSKDALTNKLETKDKQTCWKEREKTALDFFQACSNFLFRARTWGM